MALIVGGQRISILIRGAHEQNGGLDAESRGIGHSQIQFAAIALAKQRRNAEAEQQDRAFRETWSEPSHPKSIYPNEAVLKA